ncbi:hypothetical protein ACFYE2_00535 [Kocuria sp. CPCC 205300]|uniref:hypothetical protein n=1 Tax=Kocuria sabuli TaxID=3071448 RepID=UPI0036D88AB8
MPRSFTCTTPPPPAGDPTRLGTLPLPLYTRIARNEIQVGTIDLDVAAGEPMKNDDGTVRVPLTAKGHDWAEVIVTE